MPERILIVEDERKLADLLRDYLAQEGYEVTVLGRGDEVEPWMGSSGADLILLDLMLPGKSGLEVCKSLRSSGTPVSIIMVTARVDEIDRLLGLELGADDYDTTGLPLTADCAIKREPGLGEFLRPHCARWRDRSVRMHHRGHAHEAELIKESIIIANRTGGSGTIALNYIKSKKGDPHHVRTAATGRVMSATARPDLNLGIEQFTPIGLFAQDPRAIAVRAESKFKSFKELVETARRAPNTITAAIASATGTCRIALWMLPLVAEEDAREWRLPASVASDKNMFEDKWLGRADFTR